MRKHGVGWKDVLILANDRCDQQMVPGLERWPASGNPRDHKNPPHGCGHMAQMAPPHGCRGSGGGRGGGNQGFRGDGGNRGFGGNRQNQNRNRNRGFANGGNGTRNGNGSGGRTNKHKGARRSRNPEICTPPDPNQQPISHLNGQPVFEKKINNQKMQWCCHCNWWTSTHNSGSHQNKATLKGPTGTPSAGLSMIQDPSFWFCQVIADDAIAPAQPTLKTTLADCWSLPFPHVCIAGFFSMLHFTVTCLLSNAWFCSLTIGDVLAGLQLSLAPLLWASLLLATILGPLWVSLPNQAQCGAAQCDP